MDIKQNPDGSASWYSDQEGKSLAFIGGPANPAAGGSQIKHRQMFEVVIPLTTGNVATGAAASWASPYPEDVVIGRVLIHTTTAQTTTLTASVGTASTNSTFGNNLLDAARVEAAGVVDNITDKGTAGKSRQILTAGQFINFTLFNTTATTWNGYAAVEIMRP